MQKPSYTYSTSPRASRSLADENRAEFVGRIALLTGQHIKAGNVVATRCTCEELAHRFGEPEEIEYGVQAWSRVELDGPTGKKPGWLVCYDFGTFRAVYFSGWPIGFPDSDATTVVLKLAEGRLT